MPLFENYITLLRKIIYSCEYLSKAKVREEDFTRVRKLSFVQYILLILKGTKHGLQTGLNEFLETIKADVESYSKQAFSKGRLRIKPEAIKLLFDAIVAEFYEKANVLTYKEFRLTAIDGSRYNLPNSPELREKYGEQLTSGQSQVQALSSCLYDVLNHVIMDAKIYPCKSNEREIAVEHIAALKAFKKEGFQELVLLDRGYPSGKLMQTIENAGYYYLMRCTGEFLTAVKYTGNDCIVTHSFANMKGVPLTFRVIALRLPSGAIEYLITNILDKSFTVSEFGELYRLRWQIEERYNDIKNKLQIENFSGISETVILQDFYATMLLANLAQGIIYDNHEKIEALHGSEDNKYTYVMNIAMTISELKINFLECLLCENAAKRELLFQKMLFRLEKCVIPSHRIRNQSFPRKLAHAHIKFPQNKRFPCP